MHVFPKIATQEQLVSYIQQIQQHWQRHVQADPESWEDWPARTVDVTQDRIVTQIQNSICTRLNLDLVCHRSLAQIWPVGMCLSMHHPQKCAYGDIPGVYTSVLYLNQDFNGGEFRCEPGISVAPRTGTLVFTDDIDRWYSIMPCLDQPMYTIWTWWAAQNQWRRSHHDMMSGSDMVWI